MMEQPENEPEKTKRPAQPETAQPRVPLTLRNEQKWRNPNNSLFFSQFSSQIGWHHDLPPFPCFSTKNVCRQKRIKSGRKKIQFHFSNSN